MKIIPAIDLREGRTSGVLEDGTRWQVTIERFDIGESRAAANVRTLQPYRVELSVAPRNGRDITLTSIRLGSQDG